MNLIVRNFAVTLICACATLDSVASEFSVRYRDAIEARADLAVVPEKTVEEHFVLDRLGGLVVVNINETSTDRSFKTAASSAKLQKQSTLFVVEDITTNRYGTTDGGIIVHAGSNEVFEAVVADSGLSLKHRFKGMAAGILFSDDPRDWQKAIELLSKDDRVLSAELNVNFYDRQPT
jgi:hypothetical protein